MCVPKLSQSAAHALAVAPAPKEPPLLLLLLPQPPLPECMLRACAYVCECHELCAPTDITFCPVCMLGAAAAAAAAAAGPIGPPGSVTSGGSTSEEGGDGPVPVAETMRDCRLLMKTLVLGYMFSHIDTHAHAHAHSHTNTHTLAHAQEGEGTYTYPFYQSTDALDSA